MYPIIRLPKFLRNDCLMKAWMDMAETISKEAARPEIDPTQRYELLKTAGQCINKAAKAGGFLRTKDFLDWLETHKNQ